MRTLLKLIVAGMLVCTFSIANAQYQQPQNSSPTQTTPSKNTAKEYVFMKGGKMMEYSNGKTTALTSTYTCADGSKVGTDGTVTMANGSSRVLKEGDKVYQDGHVDLAEEKPEK